LAGWDKRGGQRDTARQRQRVLRYAWANTRSDQFHDTGLPCRPFRVLFGSATGGEQSPMQPKEFTTARFVVLLQVVRQDEPTSFFQWVQHNSRQQSLKCVHSGILRINPQSDWQQPIQLPQSFALVGYHGVPFADEIVRDLLPTRRVAISRHDNRQIIMFDDNLSNLPD
jgi:hypothetical protein